MAAPPRSLTTLRLLGATGRRVSVLGFGLAALGRPRYLNRGHSDDLDGVCDVAALEARAQLGAHLDLYQVHSAKHESGVLDDRRLLAEMSELKRDGVRFGFSTTGPDQAAVSDRALDVRIDGVWLFDAVQATWNLLEPSADAAFATAHAAGVGVIVKEAVANGCLTDRNDDADVGERRRLLEHEAARLGTTTDALALRAALGRPWAGVVLSGAATVAQLQANAAALEVAWDDEAAERLATLVEGAPAYWRRRSALPWT